MVRFDKDKPRSIVEKVTLSRLVHVGGFPKEILSSHLVLEYKDKYNVIERCIRTNSGEVLVYVSWVELMGALRILPQEVYED